MIRSTRISAWATRTIGIRKLATVLAMVVATMLNPEPSRAQGGMGMPMPGDELRTIVLYMTLDGDAARQLLPAGLGPAVVPIPPWATATLTERVTGGVVLFVGDFGWRAWLATAAYLWIDLASHGPDVNDPTTFVINLQDIGSSGPPIAFGSPLRAVSAQTDRRGEIINAVALPGDSWLLEVGLEENSCAPLVGNQGFMGEIREGSMRSAYLAWGSLACSASVSSFSFNPPQGVLAELHPETGAAWVMKSGAWALSMQPAQVRGPQH